MVGLVRERADGVEVRGHFVRQEAQTWVLLLVAAGRGDDTVIKVVARPTVACTGQRPSPESGTPTFSTVRSSFDNSGSSASAVARRSRDHEPTKRLRRHSSVRPGRSKSYW